jgi:hypothetical protein
MLQLTIYLSRTADYDIALYEQDGTTPASIAATDTVRLKIGRGDSTPLLDIRSGVALAGGSILSITAVGDGSTPANVRLHVAQGDLSAIPPGVYDFEVDLVDDSEEAPENGIKIITQGIAYMRRTLAGGVSL